MPLPIPIAPTINVVLFFYPVTLIVGVIGVGNGIGYILYQQP